MLGFIFLYNGGLAELQNGYSSQKTANQVKGFLTSLLLLSAVQLVPAVLFDTGSHLGALWGFLLPVALFICPDWNADQPIAVMICDSVFASLSLAMSSVIPSSVQVRGVARQELTNRWIKVRIWPYSQVSLLPVYCQWSHMRAELVTYLAAGLERSALQEATSLPGPTSRFPLSTRSEPTWRKEVTHSISRR